MRRTALFGLIGIACLAHGAFAQSSAATPLPPTAPAPSQAMQPSQKAAPDAKSNTTGAPKTKDVKPTEQQKTYTGSTGKKAGAGTACSSARPTANGGVDCGTSGNAATTGRVPK